MDQETHFTIDRYWWVSDLPYKGCRIGIQICFMRSYVETLHATSLRPRVENFISRFMLQKMQVMCRAVHVPDETKPPSLV